MSISGHCSTQQSVRPSPPTSLGTSHSSSFPRAVARLEQKCPVYRQLDGLLGGVGGGSHNMEAEMGSVDAGPARLSHDDPDLTHHGRDSHRLLPGIFSSSLSRNLN